MAVFPIAVLLALMAVARLALMGIAVALTLVVGILPAMRAFRLNIVNAMAGH